MASSKLTRAVDALVPLDDSQRKAAVVQAEARAANEAEKKPLPLKSMAEYLATDLPVPPELVSPYLIVREGLVCTVARSGKGKTVFNMNRLVAWAAGKPLFPTATPSLAPSQPLKSLIIENEGTAPLFQRQVRTMIERGPFTPDERKLIGENLTIWGDGGFQNLLVDDPNDRADLLLALEDKRPDILFIEPLRQLHSKNENDSQEMSKVLMDLQAIAHDFELCVITAHHERKSGGGEDGEQMSGARGSTVLEGATTAMESLRHIPEGDYAEVSWTKSRYGARPDELRMKWNDETNWYEHVPVSELEGKIIAALSASDGKALTTHSLAEAIGEKYDKTRRTANRMVENGVIARSSSGRETIFRVRTDDSEGMDF